MFKRQPPAVPRLEKCAGLSALIVGRFAEGLHESVFCNIDLTLPRLNVLMALNDQGEQTTAEIAKVLHSDLSTVMRALARLREQDLVEQAEPLRGRKRYRVTEKGQRRLRAAMRGWRTAQADMEQILGRSGIQALHTLAQAIVTNGPRKIRRTLHPSYPFRLNEDRY